jgi:transposase-like protein
METQNIRIVCPKCGSVEKQIKKGRNRSGTQRYWCNACDTKYTPDKKTYSDEIKQLAVKAYLAGNSARKVGRMFGMDGNTVTAWVIFFRGKSAVRQSKPKSQN